MPAWPNLSSLPPAEGVLGKRQIWVGQGWAPWSRKNSTAVLGVTRGHYPQLGTVLRPERIRIVGRDRAAVVPYVNKELAIYHLTCCGVMKHKLLPSHVFTAPGRGNMILHIKAAHNTQVFKGKGFMCQSLGGGKISMQHGMTSQLGPSLQLRMAAGN